MNIRSVLSLCIIVSLLAVPASAYTAFEWCSHQDVFFWNSTSDITGYHRMDQIPQIARQTSITTAPFSSASGEITLGTWATPMGSPGVVLAPGLWRFRTYAYSSTTSGDTTLKFYAINRSSTGIETVLFFGNAITQDIESVGVPKEYLTSYARRNYTTIFPNDRLVIRINASTNSASARTLTYEMDGNTNASMVSVGYFLCPAVVTNQSALEYDFRSDATAAAFGIVGGLITSVLILKRRKDIDIQKGM